MMLLGSKNFVPGESKFEISESESLEEREKTLSYDLTHPGDYKFFFAESKGTGKFLIQVVVVTGKKELITDSNKTLQGKQGPNSIFELEFQVKKNQIPCSFDVKITDQKLFFKKAFYAFRLTKSEDSTPKKEGTETTTWSGGELKPLTEEQLKELNKTEKKVQAKVQEIQNTKVQVKFSFKDETTINEIDLSDSYESTLERLKKLFGDSVVMKYKDNENELISINSGNDLKGFLVNVEKRKSTKDYC